MTIGQRLRYFRKMAKKTQDEVFQETGIPQTTYSAWERDFGEPGASDLLKLAKCFERTVGEIIGEQANESPNPAA